MKIKSSISCDKFSARRMKFQIYLTLFSSLSLGIDKSSLSLLSFLRQLRISEPPPKFCLCEAQTKVVQLTPERARSKFT